MTSPDDDFAFGNLPRLGGGGRWPPRREFGVLIIALVVLVSVVVVWRGLASEGDDGVIASSAPSLPMSPGVTVTPSGGSPSGAQTPGAPETLAPQLQKIMDLGKPVYCGGADQPMVALTFDDGPGPYTQYTIDTLRAAGARATFFLVGKLFSSTTNQKESKVEARFGDIGDHSWNHFGLAGASDHTLASEVVRPRRTIEKYSGEHVIYFRPPWGSRDARLDRYVKSLGMIEVMWSFDTHDSEGASTDQIVRTIDKQVQAGSIILLHENRGTTRNALPLILQVLQDKGLRAVTLSTLLTEDPPTTKQLKHGQAGCF